MSIPKFTAEASIANYGGYSYVIRKHKYDYDNSVKIEPAMPPRDYYCYPVNCRTQRCKQICGLGPPIEWCEGTREVCDYDCYYYDQNGDLHGPFPGGRSETECMTY